MWGSRGEYVGTYKEWQMDQASSSPNPCSGPKSNFAPEFLGLVAKLHMASSKVCLALGPRSAPAPSRPPRPKPSTAGSIFRRRALFSRLTAYINPSGAQTAAHPSLEPTEQVDRAHGWVRDPAGQPEASTHYVSPWLDNHSGETFVHLARKHGSNCFP